MGHLSLSLCQTARFDTANGASTTGNCRENEAQAGSATWDAAFCMSGNLSDGSHEEEEQDREFVPNTNAVVKHSVKRLWHEHAKRGNDQRQMTHDEETAVKLLIMLRQTSAPLCVYDSMMEWHLKASGKLFPWQKPARSASFISRQKMFSKLASRHKASETFNMVKEIALPSSKAKARVVHSRAQAVIADLLSDPNTVANDCLFFDKDPFAPPPSSQTVLSDMNTGQCCTKTWQKLIGTTKMEERKVLLPTIVCIDGAATGQFVDLPTTAVQFALGMFNRQARSRANFWRTLGCMPSCSVGDSQGKRMLIDSGHVESTRAHHESLNEEEGAIAQSKVEAVEDLHAMLALVLEDLVTLQQTGFLWDLDCNGVLCPDVEFGPYVACIICDTVEADKLCLSFSNRSSNVCQLCRCCMCPTNESDNPKADHGKKNWKTLQRMQRGNDVEGLRQISQKCVANAFHKCQFGLHNRQGVHGACPMEMLHHVQLGIFKHARDAFFLQLGQRPGENGGSATAKEMDSLAQLHGKLCARQSERDMPKTRFSKGIRTGTELMGKEMPGVLLLMLALLRSGKGQVVLRKRTVFRGNVGDNLLHDWKVLLETLLGWERWPKKDEMDIRLVRKLEVKNRRLMHLIKKAVKRGSNMGLKTMKFHGIVHIAEDILNFGVPSNFDSSANESHHKASKLAAKLTQKRKRTFDEQTGGRTEEMNLLRMANTEFGGKSPWECGQNSKNDDSEGTDKDDKPSDESPVLLGGKAFWLVFDAQTESCVLANVRKNKGKTDNIVVETALLEFLGGLQACVAKHCPRLMLLTNHKRNGTMFRGSPHFHGDAWRDWAAIDWEEDGKLPSRTWGFVDLSDLPTNSGLQHGGLMDLQPGKCATIESSSVIEEDESDAIIRTVRTDVATIANKRVQDLTFCLADVDAFYEPAAVVPDIGGPPNQCFWVQRRQTWSDDFEAWLKEDIEHDDCVTDEETLGQSYESSINEESDEAP